MRKKRWLVALLVLFAVVLTAHLLIGDRLTLPDAAATSSVTNDLFIMGLALHDYAKKHGNARPGSFAELRGYVLATRFAPPVELFKQTLAEPECQYLYFPWARSTEPILLHYTYHRNGAIVYWLDATGHVYSAKCWFWPKWRMSHGYIHLTGDDP